MTLTPPTFPARSRAQLTATTIHLARGGRPVLTGVDLAVTPQSRWGVVGENGRGKSTLLHVLTGVLAPDSGTVRRHGSIGVAEQEMSAREGRTVGDLVDDELSAVRAALRELDDASAALAADDAGHDGRHGDQAADRYAVALEAAQLLDAWDADRRVDVALERLDAVTDRTRKLAELSVGQRYRVRLAALLGAGHDFLLLDEPTNHLDRGGLDYLTDSLRSYPGGVVLVSHDRALLSDVAETILDLDPSPDGRPSVYGDGFTGYRDGRRAQYERWVSEYEKQQATRAELTQDLAEAQNRLVTGWRPDKGTGKHQRATRAPALVRAVHRRRDALDEASLDMPQPPLRLTMPELRRRAGAVLRVEEVTVAGRLDRPVTCDVDFGGRLVVTGSNGAGKSTLLGVLAGRLAPTGGTVHVPRDARVELLRQESPEPGTRTARRTYEDHVRLLVSDGVLAEGRTVGLSSLGLLRRAELDRPVTELSMGQQRRLDLALALASRPHALLLDEPTNHLSITLVEELTEALGATAAAVVVASHDRQLLRDIADWPRLDLAGEPAVACSA